MTSRVGSLIHRDEALHSTTETHEHIFRNIEDSKTLGEGRIKAYRTSVQSEIDVSWPRISLEDRSTRIESTNMSADDDGDAVDLDATPFSLDNVEIMDDEVDVHNKLICEDCVDVNVDVDVNVNANNCSSNKNNNSNETVVVQIDEEKKKVFEKKRDKILSGVPEEVKERFGKIYFSTFGKFLGPVLIMNPFKVEPGLLRDQWIAMFRNCQKSGREEQMTHLTYWYGQFDELNNAYSFQKTSQLLRYEVGIKKTEKKLENVRQKQNDAKKLSGKDLNFINGFDEMEADRAKDPSERFGYVNPNFMEEYHVIVEEEQIQIQEKSEGKEKKKTKNKSNSTEGINKKKKKVKKGKNSTQTTDAQTSREMGTQEVVENGETTNSRKKLAKKRNKKGDSLTEASRPKKKKKNSEAGDQDSKISGQLIEESLVKENGKQREEKVEESGKGDDDVKKGIAEVDYRKPSAYEEFAELDESSSQGETDDDSLEIDELESDGDSADDDFFQKSNSKAMKKNTLKKKAKSREHPSKSKEAPKKKVRKTKKKIEKSVVNTGEKKSTIKLNLKKSHKNEQRKFHRCEIEHLPLLRRWEKAIANKDVNQLSRIYDELVMSMENFTAPFIEEYGMSNLMKQSKGFDNDKRKVVLSKFKTVYKEKKAAVPQDFKAVKESDKYVSVDVKAESYTKPETAIEELNHLKELIPQPPSEKDGESSDQPSDIKNIPDPSKDALIPAIPKSMKKSQSSVVDADIAPPSLPLQKQNQSSTKIEKRKSFSLGKYMCPGSSSSAPGSGGAKVISSSEEMTPSSQSSKKNQTSPPWTIETISNEDYSNENRTFGLEFLQQATLYIPEGNTVNRNAIARNLELAIYNWSTGNVNGKSKKHEEDSEGSRLDKYWNKIHDLAACISGKRQRGTLAGMIAEGKFATPDELVGLGDDDLWCSFQGSPLSGY